MWPPAFNSFSYWFDQIPTPPRKVPHDVELEKEVYECEFRLPRQDLPARSWVAGYFIAMRDECLANDIASCWNERRRAGVGRLRTGMPGR
jgi:hypothetical protein